jgi:N-acetylneuraminic acid mutarotase
MTGGRGRAPRLRGALLVAVVAAIAVLAVVIATDPRRIGIFPGQPGRSTAPGEAGWVRMTDAPVALTEVAAAVHNGRIWVAGGLDDGGRAVDRVLAYDPATDTWSESTSLPEPVHHAALVSDGVGLFLLGGYAGDDFSRPSATVWRTDDPDVRDWEAVESLPEPRGAGAGAWDGQGAIVFAGGVGPDGVSADVFILDDGGWRKLTTLSQAREHVAASSSSPGTETFLGGRAASGNLATVDRVTASGAVERLTDLPTARGGIAAFAADGLGDCVVGGEGPNGTFAAVECIREGGAMTLPGLGVPRHGLGAVVVDGRAFVLLGGPRPGLTVSAVVEALNLPLP